MSNCMSKKTSFDRKCRAITCWVDDADTYPLRERWAVGEDSPVLITQPLPAQLPLYSERRRSHSVYAVYDAVIPMASENPACKAHPFWADRARHYRSCRAPMTRTGSVLPPRTAHQAERPEGRSARSGTRIRRRDSGNPMADGTTEDRSRGNGSAAHAIRRDRVVRCRQHYRRIDSCAVCASLKTLSLACCPASIGVSRESDARSR